jgi:hypothetical protein
MIHVIPDKSPMNGRQIEEEDEDEKQKGRTPAPRMCLGQ